MAVAHLLRRSRRQRRYPYALWRRPARNTFRRRPALQRRAIRLLRHTEKPGDEQVLQGAPQGWRGSGERHGSGDDHRLSAAPRQTHRCEPCLELDRLSLPVRPTAEQFHARRWNHDRLTHRVEGRRLRRIQRFRMDGRPHYVEGRRGLHVLQFPADCVHAPTLFPCREYASAACPHVARQAQRTC